jgi:hypothetical protein
MRLSPWNTEINLADIHSAYGNGDMTIQEVAAELAKRLKANPHYSPEVAAIAEKLLGVKDADEYDSLLSALYDYGDEGKRIWFKGF